MSDSTPSAAEKQTPEQIQAEIEARRDRIAANVDALTDKLDVKAHAKDAVHEAGARVSGAVGGAKDSVSSAAGSAAGSVSAGSRTLVERFRELPLPAQAAIGAAAVALVVAVVRSTSD